MKYWLVKSEPLKYSWDNFVKDKQTIWDGVRNYQARNNLKEMQKGDMAFFYHSNERKEIVGIAEVSKEYFQDPTTDDTNWVAVELKPKQKLKKTITLSILKSIDNLKQMQFLKQERLSVSLVTAIEWKIILELSK